MILKNDLINKSKMSSLEKTECSICSELFNKTTRRKIPCIKCDLVVCYSCLKKYMGTIETQLNCMGCGVFLPVSHFVNCTPKIFYRNLLREHNTDILLNEEKALLPSTLHLVEIEKEKDRLREENMDILQTINVLRNEMNGLYRQRQINANKIHYGLDNGDFENMEKKKFIYPCPVEECRGFLSTKWKCGVCDVKVCKDCLEILEDEHKCNEENIESAKIIKKQTKPCPECGARIMKSEGCDHMFCTAPGCNTGFSWRTGKKISDKENTNPYYYEWMRNNGGMRRQTGDVICGGLPTTYRIEDNLEDKSPDLTLNLDFYRIRRCVHHVQNIELENNNPEEFEEENTKFRVSYLMNRINENFWRDCLKTRLKSKQKKTEIHQILSMFVETMTEFLIELSMIDSDDRINEICRSIVEFRKYVNNEFKKLVEIYNNVMPFIDENWSYTSIDTKFVVKKIRPIIRSWRRNY